MPEALGACSSPHCCAADEPGDGHLWCFTGTQTGRLSFGVVHSSLSGSSGEEVQTQDGQRSEDEAKAKQCQKGVAHLSMMVNPSKRWRSRISESAVCSCGNSPTSVLQTRRSLRAQCSWHVCTVRHTPVDILPAGVCVVAHQSRLRSQGNAQPAG
jgi:hypothetical protein